MKHNVVTIVLPARFKGDIKILVLILKGGADKVGHSHSKKVVFICFNVSQLKMMKNIYFTLKALFFLGIFTFLS